MIKWTPKAVEDLNKILEHIAKKFSEELAASTIDELIDQVELILSHNPLAGSLLESNPLFSKLIVKGNTVYYCENPKDRHIYIVYVQGRHTDFNSKRIK
jgi:plasmid stabilization system protein ParE